MLKPALIACFAALTTFAIVVGCNAPSTDGNVSSGGSKARGDDDDDDSTSGKSSTSSSGSAKIPADCTKLAPADPRAACDECTRSKCCESYAACVASPACKQQADCIAAAADPIAAIACGLGDSELNDFGACVSTQCKAECPATLDAGSLGGDPFGDDAG